MSQYKFEFVVMMPHQRGCQAAAADDAGRERRQKNVIFLRRV